MEPKKEIDLAKLLKECSESNNTLTIKEITDLMKASFSILYNTGDVLKNVENKLGKKEFNIFISSLLGTLLANMYSNSKENK